MRRAAILISAVVALLVIGKASADVLVFANGSRRTGTVDEVAFLKDGVPGIYPRRTVLRVELSGEGDDVVVLRPDVTRKGLVTSVRFRSSAGIAAIARSLLQAIELNADEAVSAEPPEETTARAHPEKKEAPPPDKGDAHEAAIYKNLALRNAFWDKAEELKKEEIRALKSQYLGQCKQVVDSISRAQRTIDQKERRRREADRRWREEENRRRRADEKAGRKRRRSTPRPQHNDSLEKDRRALHDALRKKAELQKTIRGEVSKVSRRARERQDRVKAIYARQRAALEAGQQVGVAQMRERYEAAMAIGGGRQEARKQQDKRRKKDAAAKKRDPKKIDKKKRRKEGKKEA